MVQYDRTTVDYEVRLENIKSLPGFKLNVGCGSQIWPGWVGVDKYTNNPEVIRVSSNQIPLPSGIADVIVSSHASEHAPMVDGERTINEFHRLLKPGGSLFLMVPDLENICRILIDPAVDYKQKWSWYIYTLYGYQADTVVTPQERDGKSLPFDPGQVHYVTYSKERIRHMLATYKLQEMWTYDGWGTPSIFCHAIR